MGNAPAGVLHLNQRLEIEITDGTGKDRYASYAVDINRNGITAAAPMLGNRIIALPVGTRVRVVYSDDTGVFGFPAVVAERKQDTTPLLVLTQRGPVEKVQRRNFVRLSTSLPARYVQYPDKTSAGTAVPTEAEYRWGRIFDISGGGIQLVTDGKLPLRAYLLLEFHLPRWERIQVIGEVVRLINKPGKPGQDREHSYGIRFEQLSPQIQDHLVKYIFEEQLILRRKGLL